MKGWIISTKKAYLPALQESIPDLQTEVAVSLDRFVSFQKLRSLLELDQSFAEMVEMFVGLA